MRRLLVVVLLAITTAACSSRGASPSAPSNQPQAQTITSEALVAFFTDRFSAEIAAGELELDFGVGVQAEILDELHLMGINTIEAFAAIVPADYGPRGIGTAESSNVAGVTRDLMIIHDARRYFEVAWRHAWSAGEDDFAAPEAYGVTIEQLRALGVFGDGEGEGDPCGADPCGGE